MKGKNNIYILDAGHGGIDENGDYLTAGKRSPVWHDGKIYYEGEGNRLIVEGIAEKLDKLGIEYHVLVPEVEDVALWERVKRIKELDTDLNKIVISVHSNGFHKSSANGWEVFTSKGNTESDNLAKVFHRHARKQLGDRFKMRGCKEADFYMLKRHPFTAILTENLFHTNERDCRFLMSYNGRREIIKLHVNAIQEYEGL